MNNCCKLITTAYTLFLSKLFQNLSSVYNPHYNGFKDVSKKKIYSTITLQFNKLNRFYVVYVLSNLQTERADELSINRLDVYHCNFIFNNRQYNIYLSIYRPSVDDQLLICVCLSKNIFS